MRVAGLWHFYPPFRNAGSERMAHALLKALVDAGHSAAAVLTHVPEAPPRSTLDGVEVFGATPASCRSTVERLAPDVIISHHHNGASAIGLARTLHHSSVLVVHNDASLSRRQLSLGPDLVVFNSAWLRAELDTGRSPSLVVHPPVWPHEHRTTPGDCVTLVNLSEGKGCRVFYELARRLPAVRFIGVLGAYDQQSVERHHPNIEFIDQTTDMRSVWSRTRVLIVPSVYESYGMVGPEAMASGIPVIASPTPGLRESLGEAGIFVAHDDMDGWAREVTRLLDGQEWARASRAALERSAGLDPRVELAQWVRSVEQLGESDRRRGSNAPRNLPRAATSPRAPGGLPSAAARQVPTADGNGATLPALNNYERYVRSRDGVAVPVLDRSNGWERLGRLLVTNEVSPGDIVLDIGAKAGSCSMLFSRLVGPDGRVIAFEPDAEKFAVLCGNVELNGCANVTAVQGPALDVDCLVLDDVADRPHAVDFVKMDMQGWEGQVLERLLDVLAASPRVRIMTAFWPIGLEAGGIGPGEFLDRLAACGFNIHLIDDFEGVQPFDRDRLVPVFAAIDAILFCTRDEWRPSYELPTTRRHVQHGAAAIARHIPATAPVVLIDQEKSLLDTVLEQRRCFPFLERNGRYHGLPADDGAALRELARLREVGAAFVVLAWPAFWWQEYYPEFLRHLNTVHRRVYADDSVVIFDVRG